MDQDKKLESLKKYMLKEFGVTPDNIDKKLNDLKKQFIKKTKEIAI